MKPKLIIARLAAAALTGLIVTTTAGAQAPIKPPHLDYRETRLSNGLKVITLEDHRAPVVTVQVWYAVGSKDEAKGKAGFAHMFEHLMFKGSAHVPSEGHAKFVEAIGGDYNADTSFDRTRFFETVPSNALDRMLFLEADRMATLTVDEKNMISERKVVEEEHRLRVENAPYGTLLERVQALLYPPDHPYAHTTIGIMQNLDDATLADVKAFHDEYYKPNDATLVLVGDFNTADALAKVRKYFGPIPAAVKKFTRYPFPTVEQTKEGRDTVYDKLAQLPIVVEAYRAPVPTSPDSPALSTISIILSSGQSSRLNRTLVNKMGIAVAAQGEELPLKYGGLFFFFGVANVGKAPEELEKALDEQVNLLRTQPVSEEELTKAKNQALTSLVFGNLSTEEKATDLAEADLVYGTPAEVNKEFAELSAVTAADIQRVAQKYFAPNLENVLYMLPARMKKADAAPATPEAKR